MVEIRFHALMAYLLTESYNYCFDPGLYMMSACLSHFFQCPMGLLPAAWPGADIEPAHHTYIHTWNEVVWRQHTTFGVSASDEPTDPLWNCRVSCALRSALRHGRKSSPPRRMFLSPPRIFVCLFFSFFVRGFTQAIASQGSRHCPYSVYLLCFPALVSNLLSLTWVWQLVPGLMIRFPVPAIPVPRIGVGFRFPRLGSIPSSRIAMTVFGKNFLAGFGSRCYGHTLESRLASG